MATAFRYALYVWIVASAVALVVQLVRRRRFDANATSDEPGSETGTSSDTTSEPASTASADSTANTADTADTAETGTSADTAAGTGSTGSTGSTDTTGSPAPVDDSAPAAPATGGATADSGSSKAEAGTASGPQPIADLLDGIRLPAELAPIVPDGVVQDDSYLCLLTNTASPEDVGLKLSLELERLGYEVHGTSEQEAIARRDDDIVSLHIDPSPNEAVNAGLRRYPQATPGDVVVEIWTGLDRKR